MSENSEPKMGNHGMPKCNKCEKTDYNIVTEEEN